MLVQGVTILARTFILIAKIKRAVAHLISIKKSFFAFGESFVLSFFLKKALYFNKRSRLLDMEIAVFALVLLIPVILDCTFIFSI